jgi:hexosaminidase
VDPRCDSPSARRRSSRSRARRIAELRALGDARRDILRRELGASARVRDGGAAASRRGRPLMLAAARHAGRPEYYRLDVTSRGVAITAPRTPVCSTACRPPRAARGRARADRREHGDDGGASLRGVHIADAPRFSYRGLHLDVGRHFCPVTFVKRYIDLMSRYKYNTFHWHLTEDQGWRIEIKKYPRSPRSGVPEGDTARTQSNPYVGDSIRYCGSYTQDEIRDVVAYAKTKYITVIPEIEMPGHSLAALTAYPELGCGPVRTRCARRGESTRTSSARRKRRSPSSRTCSPR